MGDEAICSSKCAAEMHFCSPQKDECCNGLKCAAHESLNVYTCQKKPQGLEVGETCKDSKDCASGYCYKPSCDIYASLGLDCNSMAGMCVLSSQPTMKSDIDVTKVRR